jgi:hypothetical protein
MKAILPLLALLLAAPALAADPVCANKTPTSGFEAWGKPSGDALMVGMQATLALKPAGTIHFMPALARAPKDGTYGGYFALTVPTAGTYRFALSDGAWIDVVRQGARLHSMAHEHGPDCSGIRKIVAFQLEAGRSYVQLSEAKAATIAVMVVKG